MKLNKKKLIKKKISYETCLWQCTCSLPYYLISMLLCTLCIEFLVLLYRSFSGNFTARLKTEATPSHPMKTQSVQFCESMGQLKVIRKIY